MPKNKDTVQVTLFIAGFKSPYNGNVYTEELLKNLVNNFKNTKVITEHRGSILDMWYDKEKQSVEAILDYDKIKEENGVI